MEHIHGLHKDTLVDIKGRVNKRQGVPINLSNIELGDYIKGYDVENGVIRYNKVVSKWERTLDSYLQIKLSDGTELKTSVDIKIYKDGEWVSPVGNESCGCGDCKCGTTPFFNGIKITSVKLVEKPIELISIEVEPDHNYFVGELLIHNTGPQGAKGQKGQKGSSGSAGSTGAKGATGAQGASSQGPKGSQGAQGTSGSSTQGAQGPKGSQGASPQGAQGAQGPKGSQGAQGSSPKGDTGAQGPKGSTGAQGASPTGAQGAQGPKGSQGAQGNQGGQGQKGASAIGTLIGGAEVGPSGGFAYSATDGLLTFQSGSTKFVVLMYTSGSS